jgi:tRNA (pseudouridine54-N1)-methyltransferase
MREFILLAHKAKTTPDFDINNLPEAGRMDLVCRTVSNTLWISNDLRRDTIVHVSMNGPSSPPKIVSFYGESLKNMEPDEKTIASAIRDALKIGLKLQLNEEKEISPGIKISKKSFEALIKEKSKSSQMVYLHEKGEDIRKFEFKENVTFVLGDYIGVNRITGKFLDRLGAEKINLGPVTLFASHCPIIVHNELDRRWLG